MASKRWLGRASAVAQVDTVTVADTWAATDTITLTINAKDLVVTIGSLITTAQVATTIQEAWENSAFADTTATKIPGDGGQDFAEHAEITATVSGSVVTLTHDTDGVPFTMTVVAVTIGDGDTTHAAAATAATGPNFYSNADNWDPTNVPVAADDVFIDNSAVSILFGLSQGAVAISSFTVARNFTGDIGLPKTNAAGYAEYRDDYLALGSLVLNIGRGEGSGSGRIKIDSGTGVTGNHDGADNASVLTDSGESFTVNGFIGWTLINITDGSFAVVTANTATTVTGVLTGGTDDDWDIGDAYTIDPPTATIKVENTGSPAEFGIEAFLWRGTNVTNTLDILDGSVGVAPFGGELAAVLTLRQTSGTVRCGAGCTLTTVSNQSGNLTLFSNVTTLTNATGTILVGGAATVTTLNANGGTVDYQSSGTIITSNIGGPSGATVDFSGSNLARTLSIVNLNAGGQIIDPLRTVTYTSGISLGTNAEMVEVR